MTKWQVFYYGRYDTHLRWGSQNLIGSLVEGGLNHDWMVMKHSLQSFPRVLYSLLLYCLEIVYSKNMGLAIASGGIKWSLQYNHKGNGVQNNTLTEWLNNLKMGRGDCPLSDLHLLN